jgi:hypothetical protein
MLDVNPTEVCSDRVRFNLHVIFNDVCTAKRKNGEIVTLMGTTGGEIIVNVANGKLSNYTKEETILVEYAITGSDSKKVELKAKPSVTIGETEIQLGESSWGKGNRKNQTAAYSNTEKSLSVIDFVNSIKWIVALPDGIKVYQDNLLGNLNVYFESTGNSGCQEGSITIRVTDIDFYDRKRKLLWEAKSKVIRFLYHMKNIPKKEQIETTVYFKVKPCKMNHR